MVCPTRPTLPEMDASAPPEMMAGAMGGVLGWFLINLAWVCVAFGAIVHSSSAAYLIDTPDEPVPAFRAAFGRAWRLIMANFLGLIIAGLAATLVLIVLAIPMAFGAVILAQAGEVVIGVITVIMTVLTLGFYCAELGRLMLITPLIMVENRGIIDALRRSRRLSSGFVLRLATLVFIGVVISMAIALGAMITGELLIGNTVVSQMIASVLFLPFYPAMACLVVVLYYDLRVRKEGMDLELLAGAPPNSAA